MIPPKDEAEARAKAAGNALDLVDKLRTQAEELGQDSRYGGGADLARSANAAAEEVLRLLSGPHDLKETSHE